MHKIGEIPLPSCDRLLFPIRRDLCLKGYISPSSGACEDLKELAAKIGSKNVSVVLNDEGDIKELTLPLGELPFVLNAVECAEEGNKVAVYFDEETYRETVVYGPSPDGVVKILKKAIAKLKHAYS